MKRMIPLLWMASCCAWGALASSVQALSGATPGAAVMAPSMEAPTLEQIIARNIEARGGADAWRKIDSMAWTGRIESGPNGISKTPFLMLFKRPNATRFEVIAQRERSVRVFDGEKGWKLQPTPEGRPDLREYTPEEISFSRNGAWLDGPLLDYQAKGVKVAMAGEDLVENHPAFHLRLTFKGGQSHDLWIDAQSFLELRHDRPNRNRAGVPGIVSEYFRDYHTVNGLTLPFLIETGVGTTQYTDKMVIEKIALNPQLAASQFTKPLIQEPRRHGIVVNTQSPDAP